MGLIADGLSAILGAEGIERVHVFGHSLGAAIAHVLVRRHPDSVDKLILSGFGLYNPRHARLVKLFVRLPYGVLRAYYRRVIARLASGAEATERAFMRAYFEELFARLHTRETFMARLRLIVDLIDHADMYRVFVPVERPGRVLIIAAEDDRGFQPSERATLIASYPGAQVCRFESGGHWVGLTHREAYDVALYRFLKDGGQ